MTDTLPPPRPPQSSSAETKGRNCWIVGCGGCLGALAFLILLSMFLAWQVKRAFMVEPFEPVSLSAAEEARIRGKFQALRLLDAQGNVSENFEIPAQGMMLTEQEVNYWITLQDNEMADSVRVDFEPGELSAELRVGETEGKRMMLKATLKVPEDGDLQKLSLLEVKLGKFSLPSSVMNKIKEENPDFEIDPESRKAFESRVERIEILKDQILIIPRAADPAIP